MYRAQSSLNKIGARAFISTWNTSNVSTGSSSNVRVKLPLLSVGTYKFTVRWGDGSSNLITAWNQPEVTHTYATAGTYTITITGFIKGWDFSNYTGALGGDRLKIISISQWGCLRLVDNFALSVSGAFYGCENLNLSSVSDIFNFKGVKSITGMLRLCRLNSTIPNLDKWDVSKITKFRSMLRDLPLFDQNVGNWNVSSGVDFLGLFNGSLTIAPYGSFNNGGSDSIKNWDVRKAENLSQMFYNQRFFNQEIGKWDTSNVTEMQFMLASGSPIVDIPLSAGAFTNAGTDSIKNWNTSKVINMSSMFQWQQAFDIDLSNWDTKNVTNMSFMFWANFRAPHGFNNGGNPGIANWNTSKVTNMAGMFHGNNKFNQNIGAWDVSKVTDMNYMLGSSTPVPTPLVFNNGGSSSINNWSTALVTNMSNMFRNNPSFNQPIGNWNVSNVVAFANFMQPQNSTNYTPANYDNLLIGWASRPVKPNININMGTLKYTAAASAARAILTSAPNNWTIVDGGLTV